LALRNTVNYIDNKYEYLISMDDDTLFPEKFYINQNIFNDEKIGSNCFSYSYSTLRINKNERKRK